VKKENSEVAVERPTHAVRNRPASVYSTMRII
jgi:hypothetical protein